MAKAEITPEKTEKQTSSHFDRLDYEVSLLFPVALADLLTGHHGARQGTPVIIIPRLDLGFCFRVRSRCRYLSSQPLASRARSGP